MFFFAVSPFQVALIGAVLLRTWNRWFAQRNSGGSGRVDYFYLLCVRQALRQAAPVVPPRDGAAPGDRQHASIHTAVASHVGCALRRIGNSRRDTPASRGDVRLV